MTPTDAAPLSESILVIIIFGDVVFAVSGALTAARYKMDVFGYVLIGTITGIGGGTVRDLLMNQPVFWTQNPIDLYICMTAALLTYFFIRTDISQRNWMVWSDALGLSVFGVVGAHIARGYGASFPIAVAMGVVTAVGGGVLRDVMTRSLPMIVSGTIYATVALLGSLSYVTLLHYGTPEIPAQTVACLAAFALRAAAILFDIRMGPPGQFITLGDKGIEMKALKSASAKAPPADPPPRQGDPS